MSLTSTSNVSGFTSIFGIPPLRTMSYLVSWRVRRTGCTIARLRRRERRIGIAHVRPVDQTALDDHLGLGAEELRLPEDEVGDLAFFDRSEVVGHAVGDGRVDRDLGDVAQHAEVVVSVGILGELAAGVFHERRHLERTHERFADAAHSLRVGRDHRQHAQVVQHVLRGLRFGAHAALGEGHVRRNLRIEVVADHNHVEQLGLGIDAERQGGIGR